MLNARGAPFGFFDALLTWQTNGRIQLNMIRQTSADEFLHIAMSIH